MGRGKIEIKRIDNANNRQVTFSKRRNGLLKKAMELSILCEAQVAVIIYSNTGKVAEFASTSMPEILARYQESMATNTRDSGREVEPALTEPNEEDGLREEVASHKVKQLRLLGKDLKGMSLDDLRTLEQELNEGLLCIKERKEKILEEQLEQSREARQQFMMENNTLRRQVEELQVFSSSMSSPKPLPVVHNDDAAPADGSDISLQLVLFSPNAYPNGRKRKTPDAEIPRVNPESQIAPQQQSYSQYPPALQVPAEITNQSS